MLCILLLSAPSVKKKALANWSERMPCWPRVLKTVSNKTIRTFGRESHQQNRFEASRRSSAALLETGASNRPPGNEPGGGLGCVHLTHSGHDPANLGSALVFIFALYRAQPRMAALDGASVSLRAAAASIDAVTSLLSEADEPLPTTPGTVPFAGVIHDISFDRASFKYHPDDTFAIQDLSLHFPAGKTTALVGPSGAGKSTIIKLILRLYEVEHGEIRVDGRPLGTLDLASWREKIAVVSQTGMSSMPPSATTSPTADRRRDRDRRRGEAGKRARIHRRAPARLPGRRLQRSVRLSTGQLQRLTERRDPDIPVSLFRRSFSRHLLTDHSEALEIFAKSRNVIIIAHRSPSNKPTTSWC